MNLTTYLFLVVFFRLNLYEGVRASGHQSDEYKYLKGFVKNHGASHFDAYNSAHGEKDAKLYKSDHYHNKGSKGFFEKGFDQGKFGKNYGEKKLSLDAKHTSAGGKKGAEYGENEYYKNNKKQSGYGELYNADALKKNKAFYDNANKKGHFNKYGNAHSYFLNSKKGRKSGGNNRGSSQGHGYKIIKR
ncbi:hypothetical protein Trydic_g10625 [Trypoxylus dichotomus]